MLGPEVCGAGPVGQFGYHEAERARQSAQRIEQRDVYPAVRHCMHAETADRHCMHAETADRLRIVPHACGPRPVARCAVLIGVRVRAVFVSKLVPQVHELVDTGGRGREVRKSDETSDEIERRVRIDGGVSHDEPVVVACRVAYKHPISMATEVSASRDTWGGGIWPRNWRGKGLQMLK